LVVAAGKVVDQILQGSHFSPVNKLELLYEIIEVLEAGVKMSLLSQRYNLVEMRIVDVCVDSEEPLEDVFHNLLEVPRECDINP